MAFETDAWSFIRGDQDPDLVEAIIGGELNLAQCPHCSVFFFAECPMVYLDKKSELLAFIFPQSYAREKEKWQKKMQDDFKILQEGLFKEMKIDYEPILLFGPQSIKKLLKDERDIQEEVEVINCLADELGLKIQPVKPSRARKNGFSYTLPYEGEKCNTKSALSASHKILKGHSKLKSLSKLVHCCEKEELEVSSLICK
jgi:hypothetical protein